MLPAHAGMVPPAGRSHAVYGGAPRARGDGPEPRPTSVTMTPCSPRTRGWSPITSRAAELLGVLPAHAGMVHVHPAVVSDEQGAPRARGDGPSLMPGSRGPFSCSPRTRGWSLGRRRAGAVDRVLPAHAGMVPRSATRRLRSTCAPRARGDGPPMKKRTGRPQRCSPRTRGWSHQRRLPRLDQQVLPAHAGMVPARPGAAPPPSSAPRARGDGPLVYHSYYAPEVCSPRTRGWSPAPPDRDRRTAVLPAHAGMVPKDRMSPGWSSGAPRARGDGPPGRPAVRPAPECSPRTRGWSPATTPTTTPAPVLPAHAGMVPARSTRTATRTCAPRARGDGPLLNLAVHDGTQCSPRTRGWSHDPVL